MYCSFGYLLLFLVVPPTIYAYYTKVICGGDVRNFQRALRFRAFLSNGPDLRPSIGMVFTSTDGGGAPFVIEDNSPFAGRKYGGGDRASIFGTRSYGSGYPYGVKNTSTIAGRDFPYGVWPISWGDYLGGAEYSGERMDLYRPGGILGVIKVERTTEEDGPSVESFEVIGDQQSLAFMVIIFRWTCGTASRWPLFEPFDPSKNGSTIARTKPENVLQYYRASSFAIASSQYTNQFAIGSVDTQQSFEDSTPLPSGIADSSFFQCLNESIGRELPLMEPLTKTDEQFVIQQDRITGYVVASAFFVFLVTFYTWIPQVLRSCWRFFRRFPEAQ